MVTMDALHAAALIDWDLPREANSPDLSMGPVPSFQKRAAQGATLDRTSLDVWVRSSEPMVDVVKMSKVIIEITLARIVRILDLYLGR